MRARVLRILGLIVGACAGYYACVWLSVRLRVPPPPLPDPLPFICLGAAFHGWVGQIVGHKLDAVAAGRTSRSQWAESLTVLGTVVGLCALAAVYTWEYENGIHFVGVGIGGVTVVLPVVLGRLLGQRLDRRAAQSSGQPRT